MGGIVLLKERPQFLAACFPLFPFVVAVVVRIRFIETVFGDVDNGVLLSPCFEIVIGGALLVSASHISDNALMRIEDDRAAAVLDVFERIFHVIFLLSGCRNG